MNNKQYPDSQNTICCVIPCFNAAATCADVIISAKKHFNKIIAVDDGSTDGTSTALKDMNVTLVQHDRNMGKGWALLSGFKGALSDNSIAGIITLDADMQHDPDDAPALLDARPVDLIIGNRFSERIPNQPLERKLSNYLANKTLSLLCGQRILDSQSGFRYYSREFAQHLTENSQGGRFEWETKALISAVRHGFSTSFVPVSSSYSKHNYISTYRKFSDTVRIAASLLT